MIRPEPTVEITAEVLSSPALLFLYHRIEQILGIKATSEALVKLNEYLEKYCGASFIEKPAAFEFALTSREQIFDISKTVTVNETYFFREGAHFDLLARHFLPQFVKLNRPVRICSAATSIGCEAYSIAMLLDHFAKNEPSFDFELDAFDINSEAIETAKNACYTTNTLRADGAEWKYILDSYLSREGDDYVVSRNIRGKVRFFSHNIMRGLGRQYDVIFFRNALIYFSSKNRLTVLNNLADSLFNNGVLFLGVSETATARHPLLAGRYLSDVFFFQKINFQETLGAVNPENKYNAAFETKAQNDLGTGTKAKPILQKPDLTKTVRTKSSIPKSSLPKSSLPKSSPARQTELPINCVEIKVILETEEGEPNAKRVMEILTGSAAGETSAPPSGDELTASAVYFLGIQNFNLADIVLSHLGKSNMGAPVLFLMGESHLLQGRTKEAEQFFEQAAGKDKAFWPAFYRISSLAAKGNPTRYEYKIKKACESLRLGRELHYECFMGGFSPDYFERLLNQRLISQQIHEQVLT